MSIARAYTRDMSEAQLNWHDKHYQTLNPGQRAADHMRNGMGSWIFIGFMALWALINLTTRAWDPYPFILLNLFLSMLAGLQGAILLISAKRQDAISAALAQHDFETNLAAKKEIEELMAINKRQTEMLEDLREILVRAGAEMPEGPQT